MKITHMELHDEPKKYGYMQNEWDKRIGYAIDELENDPDVQKYEND